MNKVKIALLALVAVLLVVLVIDAGQRSKQLQAVHAALEKGVRVAPGTPLPNQPTAVAGGSAAVPVAEPESTDPAQRDGKPRLGVNFLRPAVTDHFRPERVRGTLKEFESLPKSLNPLVSNMSSAGRARALTNDSLCDTHPATPNLWSESLATSVRILDDYRMFVFKLRPGIRWQKPTIASQERYRWLDKEVELTADDFVFALEMINNPEVQCGHLKQYYAHAKGYALDRYTLLVRWDTREYTNISFSLGMTPLPRHVYANDEAGKPLPAELLGVTMNRHWFDGQNQLIGVGGYRLEQFVPDRGISFVRDPGYWGASLHFERIEWDDSVKDPAAQLTAFKNGQAHFHLLSPDQYKSDIIDHNESRFAKPDPADPKAGRKGELGWERNYANQFQGMAWNCARPKLGDRRTRQALAHAFPKARIFQDVFVGLGRPQVGPVHPDFPSFNKELVDFAYDLPRARVLLSEAGWTDSDGDGFVDKDLSGKREKLRLEVIYYIHNRTYPTLLAIYRDALREVGVDLYPHGVDQQEWERRSDERDFDAFVIGWNSGDLEDDFKQIWHSSSIADQGSNYAGWANAEADTVIEAHRNEFDYDKRIELSRRFQRICFDDQPYLFIRSGERVFVWQNKPVASKKLEGLAGVTEGFDRFHPLYGTTRLYWHLVAP